jgi:hypothetical protein
MPGEVMQAKWTGAFPIRRWMRPPVRSELAMLDSIARIAAPRSSDEDVFRLIVDESPRPVVVFKTSPTAETTSDETGSA